MDTYPRLAVPSWLPPRFPWGIPEPLWIRFRDIIGQTIKEFGVEPVARDFLVGHALTVEEEPRATERTIRWPRPFPGGLRTAHLHFKGELYELTPEQWEKFSGHLVADFREKLARAGTVSFDKMFELSDAIDSIG
jgi:hypothetical protein